MADEPDEAGAFVILLRPHAVHDPSPRTSVPCVNSLLQIWLTCWRGSTPAFFEMQSSQNRPGWLFSRNSRIASLLLKERYLVCGLSPTLCTELVIEPNYLRTPCTAPSAA